MKLIKKAISVCAALSLSAAMLSGCIKITITPVNSEAGAPATADTVAPVQDDAISPLMWKVTGEKGNTLYLFGTMHLGDARNKTVMQQIADETDACDALAVECDIRAFEEDQERVEKVVQSMLCTDGTDVKDHLKGDLYDKCKAYLTEVDKYNSLYDYYNLSFWSTLLQQTEVEKSDLSTEYAMDTLLLDHAKANKQEVLEVESVEFQYNMENSFPDEWYNMEIEAFFEDIDDFVPELNELYQLWLKGDEAAITELVLSDGEEDAEMTAQEKKLADAYYKAMYTDRNSNMAAKADEYLRSGKNVFFAVGEAHMVGDNGVVALLKSKGYKVEKTAP